MHLGCLWISKFFGDLDGPNVPEFGISKTRIVRHPEMQDSALLAKVEAIWKHAIRDLDLLHILLTQSHVPGLRPDVARGVEASQGNVDAIGIKVDFGIAVIIRIVICLAMLSFPHIKEQ
jgi:hypothetical protein